MQRNDLIFDLTPFGGLFLDQQLYCCGLVTCLRQLDNLILKIASLLPEPGKNRQFLGISLQRSGDLHCLALQLHERFRGVLVVADCLLILGVEDHVPHCLLGLNPLGMHLADRQGQGLVLVCKTVEALVGPLHPQVRDPDHHQQ